MPDDPAHNPCSLHLELFCNEVLHLVPYIIAFPDAFVRLEPCSFGANYRATFEGTRAEILGLRARQRQALGGYVQPMLEPVVTSGFGALVWSAPEDVYKNLPLPF